MLSSIHRQERPTRRQADEAFFFVRRGDRLAVRTRGVHPRAQAQTEEPAPKQPERRTARREK